MALHGLSTAEDRPGTGDRVVADRVRPVAQRQTLATLHGVFRALSVYAAALAAISVAAAAPLPHWTPDEDIVDHIAKQPEASIFAAALKASGLRETLKGPGRFTVLVPSNAAFAELPAGMLDDLMKPANKAQLIKIIGCHIIAHEIKVMHQPMPSAPITTIGGCKLRFSLDGTDFKVSDENGIVATLVRSDVFEANGQIDEIDGVLTPKLPAAAAANGA